MDLENSNYTGEVIKVIGIGGGGCNAIDNMIEAGVVDVEFIAANTDAKSLRNSKANRVIQLGQSLTRGLGAGSNPEVGRKAAMEDREHISEILKGTDMLFIASGMGGGTGTGASPIIAEVARSMNILTVGIVTKPFLYEGEKRRQIAEAGIQELKKLVDSLIVIPNEKLFEELDDNISMKEAFMMADEVLKGAILGITDVIKTPGMISVDFADVRTVMTKQGMSMMGAGKSSGDNRALLATEAAFKSKLLEDMSFSGVKGLLVNISTSPGSLKLKEYNDILSLVRDFVTAETDIKVGVAEVSDLSSDELKVTVIATGLEDPRDQQAMSGFNRDSVNDSFNARGSVSSLNVATSNDGKSDGEYSESKVEIDPFNKSAFSIPSYLRRK